MENQPALTLSLYFPGLYDVLYPVHEPVYFDLDIRRGKGKKSKPDYGSLYSERRKESGQCLRADLSMQQLSFVFPLGFFREGYTEGKRLKKSDV